MDEHWASGNWFVSAGKEDEFIARWTELLDWMKTLEGFEMARLVRDALNPSHFVSFARWVSFEALEAWRQAPEFEPKLGACRQLCGEMYGSNYIAVAAG